MESVGIERGLQSQRTIVPRRTSSLPKSAYLLTVRKVRPREMKPPTQPPPADESQGLDTPAPGLGAPRSPSASAP